MSAVSRERFGELIAELDPDLAEANLLIAAEAYPRLDIPRWLGEVDGLAAEATTLGGGLTGVVTVLREADLRGDRSTYDDPRNSFLNDVLDRRTGLPIALAALTVAVGRRVGLALSCVGMPGHVIVVDTSRSRPLYLDPFDDWARRTVEQCRQIVSVSAGVDLEPEHLEATSPHLIIRRMLANLTGSYMRREMYPDALWTVELHAIIAPDDPGVVEQRRAIEQLM